MEKVTGWASVKAEDTNALKAYGPLQNVSMVWMNYKLTLNQTRDLFPKRIEQTSSNIIKRNEN